MRGFLLDLTRNAISLIGAAITTASAILILTFFGIEQLGFQGGPYLGILTFVILPGIFVTGLLLIPLGITLQRRRVRRASARGVEPPGFPVIDFNLGRTRRIFLVFLALTVMNVVILALASYKGVEVMDSTAFCGQTCHSVMTPEYTTYRRSPHSNVACVNCHIGPGADWFVKSKLSGTWQLVAVTFKLYPRPIPTPVANLRPARETCEQCHWPTKFVGDRLRVLTHFAEDEKNSEKKTVLLLRVGGLQGRISQGIHWHVDPAIRIRYRADKTREKISDIELTRADGTVELFSAPPPASASSPTPFGPVLASIAPVWLTAGESAPAAFARASLAAPTSTRTSFASASFSPRTFASMRAEPVSESSEKERHGTSSGAEQIASSPWRVMDCVDCHNRPTHIYRLPEDEIDHALLEGRIDRALPFIRREGLKALRAIYPSQDKAREGIEEALHTFYAQSQPSGAEIRPEAIRAAAKQLGDIYCTNVWPSMNITWGTYPNHLGHQNDAGCFRCHDDNHKSRDGKTISQDCSTCHSVLAMDEESPEVLKQLQP